MSSQIDALNRRYVASASLIQNGVEMIAVGDPIGARFNIVARRLLVEVSDDNPELWDDLVGAVRALRWHLITQPQPARINAALRDAAEQVTTQARRLRGAVANDALLGELLNATQAALEADSPLGNVLLRSIEGSQNGTLLVIAASKRAQAGLQAWLGSRGVRVLTAGDLAGEPQQIARLHVVGPPRFFPTSLLTAPVTSALSYLVPEWFGDHSIPASAIAPYAEGAIRVAMRVSTVGDAGELTTVAAGAESEEDLLPQATWRAKPLPDREPASDEVLARKVLLSGNLAIWLDDGDRIRALNPDHPSGERVTYTEVSSVHVGTYLLLRQGETERGALYQAALQLLGPRRAEVDATQKAWKVLLAQRLMQLGYQTVVRKLRGRGVKTADRARAWTDPNLVRPNNDRDFEALLEWLGLPSEPSFGHATVFRRALYQASADVRGQLEAAVATVDLSALERDGYLILDVKMERLRGIIATRVLAMAPHLEIISRHEARVPFGDRSSQWLE